MLKREAAVYGLAGFVLFMFLILALVIEYSTDGGWSEGVILVGAALEATGILWIATPEIAPPVISSASRFSKMVRSTWSWLLRRLGRRPRVHEVRGEIHGKSSLAGRAVVRRVVNPDSSMEHKLAILIEEVDRIHGKLNDTEIELETIKKQMPDYISIEIETLRDQMRSELHRSEIRFLELRVSGVILTVVGLLIATSGSLLSVA